MQTEPDATTVLSKDLHLMMQHMLPMLASLLASLQEVGEGTKEVLGQLQSVMERIATGLEAQSRQLQNWEQRLGMQDATATTSSRQIKALSHRLDREAEGRDRLENRLDTLIDLLKE